MHPAGDTEARDPCVCFYLPTVGRGVSFHFLFFTKYQIYNFSFERVPLDRKLCYIVNVGPRLGRIYTTRS